MAHSRPYKKDLTPFAKGGRVVKHTGKGSTQQSTSRGQPSTLSGGDPYARMANRYPKPEPADLAEPEGDEPPVPMGTPPARMPTAMMPGGGGDDDGDEAA